MEVESPGRGGEGQAGAAECFPEAGPERESRPGRALSVPEHLLRTLPLPGPLRHLLDCGNWQIEERWDPENGK